MPDRVRLPEIMIKLASGHEVQEFNPEEKKRITEYIQNGKMVFSNFIRLSPGGMILSESFLKHADRIRNFKVSYVLFKL